MGTKDLETQRYHFLGYTCLKEVTRRGAVLRTCGRESGQKAYATEMGLRVQEVGQLDTDDPGTATRTPEYSPTLDGNTTPPVYGMPDLLSLVFVFETPDYYHAFAAICSGVGSPQILGYAEELRHQEVWRITGDGGLLLEQVKEERLKALGSGITSACEQAVARFKGLKPTELIEKCVQH